MKSHTLSELDAQLRFHDFPAPGIPLVFIHRAKFLMSLNCRSMLIFSVQRVSQAGVTVAVFFGALALALVAAWLGGELVYRLSVGVDAHVDSPSSLSGRPAKEKAR